ncbi:MAG: hypothetical protein ACXVFV_01785 [Mycobacteriales bacterium]
MEHTDQDALLARWPRPARTSAVSWARETAARDEATRRALAAYLATAEDLPAPRVVRL